MLRNIERNHALDFIRCTRHWLLLMALVLLSFAAPISAQNDAPPIVAFIDGDIWTYSPPTDTWKQLTDFGHFYPPVLAPDGSQIAFRGLAPDYAEFLDSGVIVGDAPPRTELWVMDLSDGQPERIQWQDENNPLTETLVMQSTPDYSPDGSLIAWTELHVTELWYYQLAVYDRESGEIVVSTLEFPEPHGGFPIAPDVKFRDNDSAAVVWPGIGSHMIAVFNLKGEPLTPTVPLEDIYYTIDFAPLADGDDTFAVLTDPFGWLRVDFATEQVESLRPAPGFGTEDRLLVIPPFDDQPWTTLAEGKTQTLPYPEESHAGIAISPDGSQIAYVIEGGLGVWQAGEVMEITHPNGLTPTALLWSPYRWYAD